MSDADVGAAEDAIVMDPESPLRRPDFLVGFATSEYQASGARACPHNSWSDPKDGFELRSGAVKGEWSEPASPSGGGCGSWDNIARDIDLIRSTGANSYRFSVEWSVVEPSEGTFDAAAIAHYHQLIDALIAARITPMVTLHHFTVPSWFARIGGFELAENVTKFVRFSTRVFAEYGSKVPFWCTVNEPGCFCLSGYIAGVHWPGRIMQWSLARTVMANLLRAHSEVYAAIKAAPGGAAAQVGIVHNVLKFEATISQWTPVGLLCRALNGISHDPVMEYFRADSGRAMLDFFGLNFYSRVRISSLKFWLTCLPGETMTDLGWATNPQSFHDAIVEVSTLGKPVYITENGMTNMTGGEQTAFLRGYLTALVRAINEGCDVRGYFWWTLLTNFEWHLGYTADFGLFGYDVKAGQVKPPSSAVDYFRRAFAKREAQPKTTADEAASATK